MDQYGIDQSVYAAFQEDGYAVVRGLFTPKETAAYRDHFMDLRAANTYPGDFAGVDLTSSDPLKRFPRMIHMHRWDQVSLQWLLDPRLDQAMTALLGASPFAVQTMLYFKPPGGRGQALHQDQYYLRVQPGTCLAAWMALDDCDEENGCLQVVPGTHTLPLLCTVEADTSQSFTDVTVPLADGMTPIPVQMQAGDVLFFNGQLVHGSFPNTSQERFRRS
ncbi:MAG: phytanoyl-CoA dioxygenase family protein, partial [Caldilineaceae bacterium]|nr:phytanoyl-CoA dioxygenase family protein [Caldilineaceae bacterium]